MHFAAKEGHLECVRALLDVGVDRNAKTKNVRQSGWRRAQLGERACQKCHLNMHTRGVRSLTGMLHLPCVETEWKDSRTVRHH